MTAEWEKIRSEWEKIRSECIDHLKECKGPADVEKTLMVLWVGWWSCLPKFKRMMLSAIEDEMKADSVAYAEELDKKNKE